MNWLPAIGIAFALAAPGPKVAPKKAEPPKIVGNWECVECIAGGRKFTSEEFRHIGYEFTADGKVRGQFGPQSSEGTYTADPTKDPAELDCVSGKPANSKGGIYKVEKDTLTLCFVEGGGDRPKRFDAPAGTRTMLLTFKRVEKKE